MTWENWVKMQLRQFLCRQIDLEKIEMELRCLEDDVFLEANRYDQEKICGTPYRKGSVVEFSAIRRERIRNKFESKKEWLLKKTKVIENALDRLTPFHREIINNCFLSLDCKNDQSLAEKVNVPVWAINAHKRAALSHLYDDIMRGYDEIWKVATKEALCSK